MGTRIKKTETSEKILNYLAENGKGTVHDIHLAHPELDKKAIVSCLKKMNGWQVKARREGKTSEAKTWRLV